jgi:acetoacetyl-CoA synthetase
MTDKHTNGVTGDTVELWRHPRPESTELFTFQKNIASRYGLKGTSYDELWQWSVDRPGDFWREIWEYTGIKASKPPTSVSS